VFVQTPRSDIFVVMLSIALGAIVLGCLFLFLLLNRYEFQLKAAQLHERSASALVLASQNFTTPEILSTERL
jgi:hypothetical protein